MPKRPRDINQLAKMLTDSATGDAPPEDKNPAAVALGRLGGKKGGRARADKLTPERRSEIAKAAALKRWNQKPGCKSKLTHYPRVSDALASLDGAK